MPSRGRISRSSASKTERSTTGGSEMVETSSRRIRTSEMNEPSGTSGTTTRTYVSSGAAGTSASAGDSGGASFRSTVTVIRASRSRSPLRIEREEEQKEIAGLNTRLANYIDFNRRKDSLTQELKLKYQSSTKLDLSEIDKIKDLYDDEMASLRRALDEMSKEKAFLDVENRKMKAEWEDMKGKLTRKEAELRALARKVEQLERELAESRMTSERYTSLQREYDLELRQGEEIKKTLEIESKQRSELEAKVNNLKAELEFQNNLYREEKLKWCSRTEEIEEEVEDRARADYESKLAAELELMRQQTEEDMRKYKIEIDLMFGAKFAELKTMSETSLSNASRSRDEVMSFRCRLDEVNAELAKKQAEVESLMSRLRDMEKLLEDERQEFEAQSRMYREQNASLRQEMEKRFEEFNKLLAVKVKLDQEILAYRTLLESEEIRCRLSHEERIILASGTQQRAVDVDEEELADVDLVSSASLGSAADYSVKTSCSGPIEIVGCDGSGQFVAIKNASSGDVVVGGWQLRYVADEKETIYKFPRQLTVKSGDTCTVWSSETHTTHEPPYNVVMKGLTFFMGEKIQIFLSDKEKISKRRFMWREIAVYEMVKASRLTSSQTYTSHTHRSYAREERAGSEERCSVM